VTDVANLLNHVALQVDFGPALVACAQVAAAVAVVLVALVGVQLLLHVVSDGEVSSSLSSDVFDGVAASDGGGSMSDDVAFESTRTERHFKRAETAPRGAMRGVYREAHRARRERNRRDVEGLGFNPGRGINVLTGEWVDRGTGRGSTSRTDV
jgi:hypothetical protein